MYGDWRIGEIIPTFSITADYSDLVNGKLTLHCLAEGDGKVKPIATVSPDFNRGIIYEEEIISLGTFQVEYREGEHVFLTRTLDNKGEQTLSVDDRIRILSPNGTITETYGITEPPWVEEKPPLDITPILEEGTNEIEIFIEDIYGNSIGCNGLALIKYGKDPREEIGKFLDMQCAAITNTKLINGGSRIHVTGGEIIEITDGFYTWNGAIESIKFKEDSDSNKAIVFDIIVHVEKDGTIPPTIYTPPFCNIPNIDYQEFTDEIQGIHQVIVIHPPTTSHNKYRVKYSTGNKYPKAVHQESGSGCQNYCNWNNNESIKVKDGKFAYAYLNSSRVGCTHEIVGTEFGPGIPNNAKVTRIAVRVHYANNSKLRSPYYNKPWHTLTVMSPGMTLQKMKSFAQGRTPDRPADAWFDSANGDFGCPSSPKYYNHPNFKIHYASTLDKYKTCWVDYIYVYIEYEIEYDKITDIPGYEEIITYADPLIEEGKDEECYAIGKMRILEPLEVSKVRVFGSACNGPAWLEMNGIRREWHYSHDSAEGNTLPHGTEILEFVLDVPTTELNFLTSTHKKYGDKYADNKGCILDWIEVFYK